MVWSSATKSFKDGGGSAFTGYMASDGTNVAPRAVALDGDNVTQGSIADSAANNSTSSWSVIALLKGIYAAVVGATPAGSNVIGGVTEADGANATLGAKADVAYAGSGSASAIAALKGIYAAIAAALPAGTNNIGAVGGTTARVSANFTRPANTTVYTTPSGTTPGSLVANSTAAASVVPMSLTAGRLSSGSGASGSVLRATLQKNSTTLTNAMFRVHLYSASPTTITNGDGGTWNTSGSAAYLGKIDIAMDEPFTDGALGTGVPFSGGAINFASQTIYAVIEARGAYTPASGETFTLTLEVAQN